MFFTEGFTGASLGIHFSPGGTLSDLKGAKAILPQGIAQ
jgi:hypothetical protein